MRKKLKNIAIDCQEPFIKFLITQRRIHQLLGWIADPNWHGEFIAYNHIYKLGIRAKLYIYETIIKIKECDDVWGGRSFKRSKN